MSSGERFVTLFVIFVLLGVWYNYRPQITATWTRLIAPPARAARPGGPA